MSILEHLGGGWRLAFGLLCAGAIIMVPAHSDDVKGTTVPQTCCNGMSATWNSSGTGIACLAPGTPKYAVSLYNVGTGVATRISDINCYFGATPVWLSGDQSLLLVCFATERTDEANAHFDDPNLFKLNCTDRKLEQVTQFEGAIVSSPIADPTGQTICFCAPKLGTPFTLTVKTHEADATAEPIEKPTAVHYDGIWVMSSRDLKPTILMPKEKAAERHPVFSPDGRKVLFTRFTNLDPEGHRRADTNLAVYDLVQNKLTLLTTENKSYLGRWSPDGTSIAFFRSGDGSEIWLMAADSTNQRKIKGGPFVRPNVDSLTWSRDGKFVLFLSEGDVFAVPLSGRGLHRLTTGLGVEDRYGFSLHPDNNRIAFTKDEKVMIAKLDWSQATSSESR